MVRPLLFQLRHNPAPLILDVATGTGRVPHFVLEWPTFNGRIIGLDAAEKMLAVAVEKLRPFGNRVMFIQQTAANLPFPDNRFDAVTCLESLEFFPSETGRFAGDGAGVAAWRHFADYAAVWLGGTNLYRPLSQP